MEGRQASQPAVNQATLLQIDDDVGPITEVRGFDMRNGEISSALSLLVKPTIASGWHWRPITGLPCEMAISQTDAFIRVALAGLTANPPAGLTVTQRRKAAILVGVARAVSTERYRIETQDLIPGETATPLLHATVVDGQLMGYSTTQGMPVELANIVSAPLVLSEAERAIVAAAHMSAIGIVPVHGYSLIMTGHHYLSDNTTQSYKAFTVIERANWESALVKDWWTADIESNRDALWHKAIHPVSITLKTRCAQSEAIKKMLVSAGAGPAASRLPALESEMRAANSYLTLLQRVRPMYEEMGGSTNYVALEEAIYAVGQFPYGVEVEVPPVLKSVPETVRNRTQALAHLSAVLQANTYTVAHAYGFYTALSDENQMLATGTSTDTLKTSFSLKKLRTQSYAAYIAGQQYYGDYNSFKTRKRQAGEIVPST